MTKTAIVTGVSGQDGSYLAERLIADGHEVIGYVRPESVEGKLKRSRSVSWSGAIECEDESRIRYVSFPVDSHREWGMLLKQFQPDYFFHLAGNSFIPEAWEKPVASIQSNLIWTTNILESIRRESTSTRLVMASSSEIYRRTTNSQLDESTPLHPTNPYGITKAASYSMIESYRERYGLFACSAVLFNHESPRRPIHFVTRKISSAVASIALGLQDKLRMGNLDSWRDWGYAQEYVEAMYRMITTESPTDFVIGSGRSVELESLVAHAFKSVGLYYGDYVELDPQWVRPPEAFRPSANASKARKLLGWEATTRIEEVIEMMVQFDLQLATSRMDSPYKQAA